MTDYKDLNSKFETIKKFDNKNQVSQEDAWFSLRNQLTFFLCGFSYLGLLIISTIVSIIGVILIKENDDLLSVFVNSISYLILFIIFIIALTHENKIFLTKIKKWKNYLYGIGMGFILIVSEIIVSIIISNFYSGDPNANQAAVNVMFKTYPTISFFILCIIGPFCEEITYRVGLFDLIKRKSKILAYILEVFIFAFMHIQFSDTTLAAELSSFPIYLVISLGLTLTYDKFDLPASFMAHVLLNSLSFISVMFL